jgi:hypothetical protein
MLIWDNLPLEIMGSKVVSTKLSQEEYGKLVGLCSASGFTVSKILKKAILERMKEEPVQAEKKSREQELVVQKPIVAKKQQTQKNTFEKEDRFLYY